MERSRREEIAELLRRRLEELRQRDGAIVREQPTRRQRGDYGDLYVQAQLIANWWINAFKGKGLEEALGGEASPSCSSLIVVRRHETFQCTFPKAQQVRDLLSRNLWLLRGVREAISQRLSSRGYERIEDLCGHPRFGRDARRVGQWLATANVPALLERLGHRVGKGHKLCLALAAFFDPHQILFFDLETMGLFSGSPIAMAGFAHIASETPGQLEVWQVVATNTSAEEALVSHCIEAFRTHKALVSYNGKAFDVPYVLQRAAYYRLDPGDELVHFDLLPHARHVWRGQISDFRLSSVASEVLTLKRQRDIPGSYVPTFYQEYLADPAEKVGLLAAIVEHNREDLVQMAKLFALMLETTL